MYKIRITPQDLGYLRLFIDLVSEDDNNIQKRTLNNDNRLLKILSKVVSNNDEYINNSLH